ncbi:lipid-A-disaccharide synthase [Alishewanella longhuensis]|uniref:Lipid-A-disaccharide synthase n=1 Tax=Alishewanella longhuensis TaxID=1091037 RepID=A0ABQ3KYM1_9ALTE|nr:lipid-A-disaccharide synthase [Alishewanella longhuensis]GHG64582.1 lipid-A-disaccharide synthase [Alishewanella longhuensis]
MADLELSKTSPLKFALIAGEHSGDILGAALMVALKQQHPTAEFFGIGGPRMQAEGLTALFDMEELAVMGLVEVLGRLRRLLQVKREITAAILTAKPDVFIGIDAPDFNIPVELSLKQQGIKTVHYVSPSVWAWRHKRIFKIAKATNMVLALLPFEKAFYDKYQVPCTFVGHTLADSMPLQVDKTAAKTALALDSNKPVLAIMPGSRTNEIKLLAPDFLQAAAELKRQQPELQLITNMVTPEKAELWRQLKMQYAPELEITEFIGQARQVLLAAEATYIASGTATLEAMLAKCAMVVGYRTNWLTFQIAKRLVKLKYVSLPNLLAGRGMVTELLQDDLTVSALLKAMRPLLHGIDGQLAIDYQTIHQQLQQNASVVAANTVLRVITDD